MALLYIYGTTIIYTALQYIQHYYKYGTTIYIYIYGTTIYTALLYTCIWHYYIYSTTIIYTALLYIWHYTEENGATL